IRKGISVHVPDSGDRNPKLPRLGGGSEDLDKRAPRLSRPQVALRLESRAAKNQVDCSAFVFNAVSSHSKVGVAIAVHIAYRGNGVKTFPYSDVSMSRFKNATWHVSPYLFDVDFTLEMCASIDDISSSRGFPPVLRPNCIPRKTQVAVPVAVQVP